MVFLKEVIKSPEKQTAVVSGPQACHDSYDYRFCSDRDLLHCWSRQEVYYRPQFLQFNYRCTDVVLLRACSRLLLCSDLLYLNENQRAIRVKQRSRYANLKKPNQETLVVSTILLPWLVWSCWHSRLPNFTYWFLASSLLPPNHRIVSSLWDQISVTSAFG